jgi:hypothetical protein
MQTIFRQLLLLLAVAGFAAEAQESGPEVTEEEARAAEIDELEPGLSSQELSAEREPLEPSLSSQGVSAERERLEPSVPTAVLAQDVRRRATNNGVMDEIVLGRAEITGNQELPKVLYIVPWQKSDPGDLTGKPVNTLLDEVLAPIDRSEFIRQVEYYGDLYGKDEE